MLQSLAKLASKPSDTKIRVTRTVVALILAVILLFGWNATDVNISLFDTVFYDIPDEFLVIFFIFPLIGLIRGIFDPGFFRKAIWKKIVTTLGVIMMISSVAFLSEKSVEMAIWKENETLSTEEIAKKSAEMKTNFSLNWVDTIFAIFGFFIAFSGMFLNGKNITTKNEKFGEVIKKIRV